jgi:hypothetical protein
MKNIKCFYFRVQFHRHESVPRKCAPPPQHGEAVPQLGEAVPQHGEAVPQLGEAVPQLGEAVPQLGEAAPQLTGILQQLLNLGLFQQLQQLILNGQQPQQNIVVFSPSDETEEDVPDGENLTDFQCISILSFSFKSSLLIIRYLRNSFQSVPDP